VILPFHSHVQHFVLSTILCASREKKRKEKKRKEKKKKSNQIKSNK